MDTYQACAIFVLQLIMLFLIGVGGTSCVIMIMAKLSSIEKRLNQTAEAAPKPFNKPVLPPPPPPVKPADNVPAPVTQALRYIAIGDVKPGEKLEFAIATTWLLRLAALVILTGIGFFVHYSYTRNLLPPEIRICITALFGMVLTTTGVFIARKKWFACGVTLTGIGFAVLYFAALFASQMYHLYGNGTTLAVTLILTAATALVALKLDAMPVALIGMIG